MEEYKLTPSRVFAFLHKSKSILAIQAKSFYLSSTISTALSKNTRNQSKLTLLTLKQIKKTKDSSEKGSVPFKLLDKLFQKQVSRKYRSKSSLLILILLSVVSNAHAWDPRTYPWHEGYYWEIITYHPKSINDGDLVVEQTGRKYFFSQMEIRSWVGNLTYISSRGSVPGLKVFSGWYTESPTSAEAWFNTPDANSGTRRITVQQLSCSRYPNPKFCVDEDPYLLKPDYKQPPEFCVADPIIVTTGNSYQTETDYQSQTSFGLSFVRFYNSSSFSVDKGVGKKWRHGFNRAIKIVGNQAQVARSNGQTFVFNLTDGNWVGDVDIPDTLVELVDETGVRSGWEYQDKNDTIEWFNTSGQLLSITNRAGQSKTFSYDITAIDGGDDNADTLDKVTGFGGEKMLFSHDSSNRISVMTDPEGNQYSYSYDDAGNLESVTYPDDTLLDDLDKPTRTYHYENTAFPSHLTGLTDETGSRVTWDFDSEGRAISSELDGGVDKSILDFSVADQVTVTNPLGKDTTYHFETLHGVKKVTKVEGHATESCAGANQNYTYDANGYIESKTDWQDNITTYVHDARGLESSRTEASGTPEERTITTEWHTDFRLPTKITVPGQITDFVYDSQGRLNSKTSSTVQP